MKFEIRTTLFTSLAALAMALPLLASANPIQDDYKVQARAENPGFKDFSATAGQKFYNAIGPNQLACASCHTDSPRNVGKHAKTNKAIEPMAPSANAQRFTDAAKVEKWFKRNCNDALGRACSAQEKGDFMAYVLSVK
jgi:hypothetical protein